MCRRARSGSAGCSLESVRGLFVVAVLVILCARSDAPQHGHDLRIAAHHPAWHQPLTAPIYIVLGLASGAVLLQPSAADLCGRCPLVRLARDCAPARRRRRFKAAYWHTHRSRREDLHGRGGHRSRPLRQGARAGAAAHASPTSSCARWATGGTQARGETAHPCAAAWLRRPAAAMLLTLHSGIGYRNYRRDTRSTPHGCRRCWSNVGCSSPRPSTYRCSTTAARRRECFLSPLAGREAG